MSKLVYKRVQDEIDLFEWIVYSLSNFGSIQWKINTLSTLKIDQLVISAMLAMSED